MHTIDEQRIAELEEQVAGLQQAVGGGRIAVPKPTGAGQLAQLLAHQLEIHGRPAFTAALGTLGILLAAPAAPKLKVLAPGDQVEFIPEDFWEGPTQGPGGSLVYTVKKGVKSGAQVKVKHTGGREDQEHPAVGTYEAGDKVVVSGTVMHFPR